MTDTIKPEDRDTYDLIFDVALIFTRTDGMKAVGVLMFAVINAWEKDRRSMPMAIVGAALQVAEDWMEAYQRTLGELTNGSAAEV